MNGTSAQSLHLQGGKQACSPSAIYERDLCLGRLVHETHGGKQKICGPRSQEGSFVLLTLQLESAEVYLARKGIQGQEDPRETVEEVRQFDLQKIPFLEQDRRSGPLSRCLS